MVWSISRGVHNNPMEVPILDLSNRMVLDKGEGRAEGRPKVRGGGMRFHGFLSVFLKGQLVS